MEPERQPARPALGPAYRRLWGAAVVSNLGDGVTRVALPLLVAARTDSVAAVAAVALLQSAAWIVAAPIAGSLVDAADRRRTMVACDLLRVVLLATFAFLVANTDSFGFVYPAAFLLGGIEVVFDTAAGTIIPAIVPDERLEAANGRLFAFELVGEQFAGPPLGAALFAVAATLPFVLDAGTFALSAALLVAMAGSFRPRDVYGRETTSELSTRRTLRDTRAVVRWLRKRRDVAGLVYATTSIAFCETALFSILVLIAFDRLGLESLGFSLLIALAAAAAWAGSLLAEWLRGNRVSVFVIACVINGSAAISFALTTRVAVAVLTIMIWGFSIGVSNVMFVALRQRSVPDEWLGRVGGAMAFAGGLAGVLGAATAAVLGSRSLSLPVVIAGVVEIVVVLALGATLLRGLRAEPSATT